MSSEQIEDVMAALNDMGVNIVENEEASEDGDDSPEDEAEAVDQADEDGDGDGAASRSVPEKKKETIDRTDDPVRMYLREMGAVELLRREGEIAIAKRIDAGSDTLTLAPWETPTPFKGIHDLSPPHNHDTGNTAGRTRVSQDV